MERVVDRENGVVMRVKALANIVLLMVTVGCLIACSETQDDDVDASASTPDTGSDAGLSPMDAMPSAVDMTVTGPTFWQDVVPILDRSCMGCHQQGGVGPMKFDTYEETRTWGRAIVAATQARTMPPWLAKSDGSCGEFKDSEWLRDDELQTLKDWFDGNMPKVLKLKERRSPWTASMGPIPLPRLTFSPNVKAPYLPSLMSIVALPIHQKI